MNCYIRWKLEDLVLIIEIDYFSYVFKRLWKIEGGKDIYFIEKVNLMWVRVFWMLLVSCDLKKKYWMFLNC